MKNLEVYITQNRNAFDTETPNERVWAAIEQKLLPENVIETFIEKNRADFDTEIPNLRVWVGIEKKLAPELDLEGFVKKNRTDFDTEIPNLKIWALIDKKVNQGVEKRLILRGWFLRSAAAIALLVVGATIGIFLNENHKYIVIDKQMQQVDPNFRDTEKFYDQQIKAKLTQLASYNNADPSVLSDLKQIDDIQEELKAELENAPTSTREAIVRQMLDNYKIKIGILERVLENINGDSSENLDNQHKIKQQNDSI